MQAQKQMASMISDGAVENAFQARQKGKQVATTWKEVGQSLQRKTKEK